MAKLNRRIQRQKNEYTFTKKEEMAETNSMIFKDSITFLWVPKKWTSISIIFLVFAFVSFTVIPLLMKFVSITIAMLIAHGIITSSLLVAIFYIIDKSPQKPSMKALCIRFGVVAALLVLFALISIMVL